jgi:FG-GAP-like repeat
MSEHAARLSTLVALSVLAGACVQILGNDFEIVDDAVGGAGGTGTSTGGGAQGGGGGTMLGCGDGIEQAGELCLDEVLTLDGEYVAAKMQAVLLDDNPRADLVVLDSMGTFHNYLGNDDGSMQTKTPIARGYDGMNTQFVLADLDGNGVLDMVVLERNVALDVAGGDGNGNFIEFADNTPPFGGWDNPTVGNFDEAAAALDLAIDEGAAINIATADGVPDFPPDPWANWFVWSAPVNGINPQGLRTTGDYNADGHDDIFNIQYPFGEPSVQFLMGEGNGNFDIQSRPVPMGAEPGKVITAKINGDDIDDGIVHLTDRLRVYLGATDPGGTLGEGIGDGVDSLIGADAVDIAIGNIDGDATIDAVACTIQNGGEIAILLGDGDGAFSPVATLPAPACTLVAVGDFNGDGLGDIAKADDTNRVSVHMSNP